MEKKHIDDIIKKYGNLLYRAVYVQVGNRHDTQDILQEAFIRYLEKAPVFADEEHEKAWLLQVTHHLCLDFFRFRKRQNPAVPCQVFPLLFRLVRLYMIFVDLSIVFHHSDAFSNIFCTDFTVI